MVTERCEKPSRSSVYEFEQSGVRSSWKLTCCLSLCLLFLSVVVSQILLMSVWKILLATSGMLLICFIVVLLSCTVSKERILVLRSVGVQIETASVLGRTKTSFIPQQRIVDIIINEAISMHKVTYYLALLLKADEECSDDLEIIPLFTNTLPPIKVLKEIKRGCQEILFDNIS